VLPSRRSLPVAADAVAAALDDGLQDVLLGLQYTQDTHRQTDSQTDTETDSQTDRQTETQTD